MSVNRRIKQRNCDYGRMGECAGEKAAKIGWARGVERNIKVGDVLSFSYAGVSHIGVVVRDSIDGEYFVKGWKSTGLNFKQMTIAIPYERVTEEVMNAIHCADFEIIEDVAEEMTIKEIEEALGKRIKIIK